MHGLVPNYVKLLQPSQTTAKGRICLYYRHMDDLTMNNTIRKAEAAHPKNQRIANCEFVIFYDV